MRDVFDTDPLVQNDKLKAALKKAIDAGPGATWRVASRISLMSVAIAIR